MYVNGEAVDLAKENSLHGHRAGQDQLLLLLWAFLSLFLYPVLMRSSIR